MSRPLDKSDLNEADAALVELADAAALGLDRQPKPVAELVADLDGLNGYAVPWNRLAGDSIEPSVMAAPEWLLALYEHKRKSARDGDVLLVKDTAGTGKLTGVVPFVQCPCRWGVPLPVIDSWLNDLFFFGVPLIGKSSPEATLDAVLRGAKDLLGAKAAMFRLVPRSGAFVQALRALAHENGLGIAEFEPIERAGLTCGTEYDAWFNDSFSRKRRKEFRRLRSRLGEQGRLESAARQAAEPLDVWINDFKQLEEAGWKGGNGTAVACLDDIACFLDQALSGFDACGRLLFWKLSLDGKTIATLFAVICGRKAWLIKIAYDEGYSRYSPGVLLMLDVTRDLLERGDIDEVDSSAVPDHPMINHLWRDRLAMTDIMVATPGTPAVVFRLMVKAEHCRRGARALAKAVYRRLLKKGSK
ncbi:MAG: GNAT family N-acetyltransferase [Rhizobiales bacterium]|nr:GNAT family N-acetyltransferase [Hyphomicrobiales bacterium]